MTILLIIGSLIILAGISLVIFTFIKKRQLGSLGETVLYTDSDIHEAKVLYSSSLPLKGKPDAIIKTRDGIIPLEVKTGKTPMTPRDNHVMQLMAYCLLVEENYHHRPMGGILRYSETNTEFRIQYTDEAKQSVKKLVEEILEAKKNGTEFNCTHPQHNQ